MVEMVVTTFISSLACIWPHLTTVCCGVTAKVTFLESSCVVQKKRSKEKVQKVKTKVKKKNKNQRTEDF